MQKHSLSSTISITQALAIKELKKKYKNSFFGFLWGFLNPLIYLAVFSFIFSKAFPGIKNYPLYALSGLIFWHFFASTTNAGIRVIKTSGPIIKTINVPLLIFPLSSVLSNVYNLLLSFVPFLGILWFLGFEVHYTNLILIPALILYVMFILGITLLLGAINVFFRDIELFWNSITPAIFYFTPIAYSATLVPRKYSFLIDYNPLYHYIELFRHALYYNTMPENSTLLITSCISLISLGLGFFVFQKLRSEFILNL